MTSHFTLSVEPIEGKSFHHGYHLGNIESVAKPFAEEIFRRYAKSAMTAEEYKSSLAVLGLTQCGAGEFFGVHDVTSRRWAAKGPPPPVAKMLRLMVALQFSPNYVDRVINPHAS